MIKRTQILPQPDGGFMAVWVCPHCGQQRQTRVTPAMVRAAARNPGVQLAIGWKCSGRVYMGFWETKTPVIEEWIDTPEITTPRQVKARLN